VKHVHLSRAALKTIQQTTMAATDGLETGGILLGHQPTPDEHTVTVAGDPGPGAVRARNRFVRDRDHATRLADAAWQETESVWIGEWHTHPDDGFVPSSVDLDSYTAMLADDELSFTTFLAVIVVPTPSGGTLYPWIVSTDRAVPAGLWVGR
jgi:integrative and conjugative element protein (TIGR02256 family)